MKRAGPYLLALVPLALAYAWWDRGFHLDEYSSYRLIHEPNFWGRLLQVNQPPAYFVLLRGWAHFSTSEPFLRALSLPFAMGTVFLLARMAGPLAGLIAATLPLFTLYATEIRPYSMLFFGTALALYAARDPRTPRDYLGLAAALCVPIAAHAVGVFVPLAVLAFAPRNRRVLAALVPCAIFFALLFWLVLGHELRRKYWFPPATPALLGNVLKEHLEGRTLMGLRPLGIALLCLLPFGDWKASGRYFAAAAVLWAQLLAFSLLHQSVLWPRTTVVAMVPLIPALALQWSTIRLRPVRWAASLGLVGIAGAYAFTWVKGAHFDGRDSFKTAELRLKAEWRDRDFVVLYPWYLWQEKVGTYHAGLSAIDIGRWKWRDDDLAILETLMRERLEEQLRERGSYSFFVLSRHAPAKEMTDYLEENYGKPETLEEGLVRLYRYSGNALPPTSGGSANL